MPRLLPIGTVAVAVLFVWLLGAAPPTHAQTNVTVPNPTPFTRNSSVYFFSDALEQNLLAIDVSNSSVRSPPNSLRPIEVFTSQIISPQGAAVDPAADLVYVSDSGSDTLYVTNARGEWLVPLVRDNTTLGITFVALDAAAQLLFWTSQPAGAGTSSLYCANVSSVVSTRAATGLAAVNVSQLAAGTLPSDVESLSTDGFALLLATPDAFYQLSYQPDVPPVPLPFSPIGPAATDFIHDPVANIYYYSCRSPDSGLQSAYRYAVSSNTSTRLLSAGAGLGLRLALAGPLLYATDGAQVLRCVLSTNCASTASLQLTGPSLPSPLQQLVFPAAAARFALSGAGLVRLNLSASTFTAQPVIFPLSVQLVTADPVHDYIYFTSQYSTVERWHVLNGTWGRVANFFGSRIFALEADEVRSTVWVSLDTGVRRINASAGASEDFQSLPIVFDNDHPPVVGTQLSVDPLGALLYYVDGKQSAVRMCRFDNFTNLCSTFDVALSPAPSAFVYEAGDFFWAASVGVLSRDARGIIITDVARPSVLFPRGLHVPADGLIYLLNQSSAADQPVLLSCDPRACASSIRIVAQFPPTTRPLPPLDRPLDIASWPTASGLLLFISGGPSSPVYVMASPDFVPQPFGPSPAGGYGALAVDGARTQLLLILLGQPHAFMQVQFGAGQTSVICNVTGLSGDEALARVFADAATGDLLLLLASGRLLVCAGSCDGCANPQPAGQLPESVLTAAADSSARAVYFCGASGHLYRFDQAAFAFSGVANVTLVLEDSLPCTSISANGSNVYIGQDTASRIQLYSVNGSLSELFTGVNGVIQSLHANTIGGELTAAWLSRATIPGNSGAVVSKLQWAALQTRSPPPPPRDLQLSQAANLTLARPLNFAFYSHLNTAVPPRINVNEAVAWPLFAVLVVCIVMFVSVQYLLRLKLNHHHSSGHMRL